MSSRAFWFGSQTVVDIELAAQVLSSIPVVISDGSLETILAQNGVGSGENPTDISVTSSVPALVSDADVRAYLGPEGECDFAFLTQVHWHAIVVERRWRTSSLFAMCLALSCHCSQERKHMCMCVLQTALGLQSGALLAAFSDLGLVQNPSGPDATPFQAITETDNAVNPFPSTPTPAPTPEPVATPTPVPVPTPAPAPPIVGPQVFLFPSPISDGEFDVNIISNLPIQCKFFGRESPLFFGFGEKGRGK